MKRVFDIIVSGGVLVIFFIPFVFLMTAVRVFLGSPVFFSQIRPGLGAQPFRLYKLRSMTLERDEHGALLPDHLRLTRFGAWLRSTSLDELPSLWNVLRGDMSLVGPRPLLMEYLPRYSVEQRRRHEVRPGITGWAQVHGRNALSWEERFKMDIWYVENRTFKLDCLILWKTIAVVFQRKGIRAKDHVTMPLFKGDN